LFISWIIERLWIRNFWILRLQCIRSFIILYFGKMVLVFEWGIVSLLIHNFILLLRRIIFWIKFISLIVASIWIIIESISQPRFQLKNLTVWIITWVFIWAVWSKLTLWILIKQLITCWLSPLLLKILCILFS
jgi:hypothetical protein